VPIARIAAATQRMIGDAVRARARLLRAMNPSQARSIAPSAHTLTASHRNRPDLDDGPPSLA